MNMPLYEMTAQIKEAQSLILSGEMTEEAMADTIEALSGTFNDKALAVARFMLDMKAPVDSIDAEIKRLQARKKSITNRQESLKDYLRENMSAAGITKIECDLFTIICKKASQVLVIDDESEIPDDYVNVKTTIAPDKKAISAAIKNGVEIPGAHLEIGKSPIEIK